MAVGLVGANGQANKQAGDGAEVVHLGEAAVDEPAARSRHRQVGLVIGQLERVRKTDQQLAVPNVEQMSP